MLPIQSTPVYTLKIPSTGKEWKYRPFLVKDEKALLLAQQSEDSLVMLDTLKGIISSCSLTPLDVDRLASFDVEYIFTQLRSVSIGEFVELLFYCDDCKEDSRAVVKITINLQELEVHIPEGHRKNIPLFDQVGVMMKYPSLDTMKKIESLPAVPDLELLFTVTLDCIDYIYNGEEIFKPEDQTPEQLREFLEHLTSSQFLSIQQFFSTLPNMRTYVTYNCPVCKKHHHKYMEGLLNFF